jgi:putative CocE/NonD family hydrolase
MRDGVKLAVDVVLPKTLPKGTRLPTILDLTRYWRNKSAGQQIFYLVAHGYAMVVVDVRGTGASTGVWSAPFSKDEIADDRDIVNWVVAQPWCDGNLGAIGTSYEGGTAQFLAVTGHPAVKAVIPRFQEFDEYTDLAFPGGILAQSPVKRWQDAIHELDNSRDIKPVDKDKNSQLLRTAIKDHSRNIDVYKSSLKVAYRDDKPDSASQTLDSISAPAYQADIEQSNVAIYGWGGWMDATTADAVIRRFMTFTNPQKGMIGPWNHGGFQNASPYRSPFSPNDPQLAECLRYLDYYLKRRDNGAGAENELIYYTMGEEKWKSTKTWPPTGTTFQDWYFGEGHTLSPSAPQPDSGVDTYTVDFEATTGKTNRWQTEVGGGPVSYPDRAVEDNKLLTYTSAPLSKDIEITGAPIVDLHITSTHSDGAFFVYLEEVDENGKVTYLTEGELRALHRKLSSEAPPYKMLIPFHSFKHQDGLPLVPGQVAELKFGLLTTSTLIRKGHRLRVAIAGADKDTFLRIPTEGVPQISLERNAKYPSSIRIPVVPGSNHPPIDPGQRAMANLGINASFVSNVSSGTNSSAENPVSPTVDQIVGRYIQALGGQNAIARISTRVTKGFRISSNGVDDSFENYSEHPDKAYGIRRFAFGIVISGSVGQDAWVKVNDEPARPVTDGSPEKGNTPQYLLQNALHVRELYSEMKLKGVETAGDRSAYIIDAVNSDGNPARLCFDVSTGLLVCSIQKQKVESLSSVKDGWTAQKVFVDVENYFGDYRNIDGVMVAFFINTVVPSGLTTTIYTEVKNNVEVNETVFKRPQ